MSQEEKLLEKLRNRNRVATYRDMIRFLNKVLVEAPIIGGSRSYQPEDKSFVFRFRDPLGHYNSPFPRAKIDRLLKLLEEKGII